MEKQIKLCNMISCITTLFLGMYIAAYQSSLPELKGAYGMNEGMAGIVISLHFWGSFLFPPFLGMLADKIGRKSVLLCCFMLLCISLAAMLLFSSIIVLCIATLIIGGCFAAIEGGVSTLLVDMNPTQEDRYMNLSQMSFCFGAVISPLLMNRFNMGYQIFYPVLLCLFALSAIAYIPFKFSRFSKNADIKNLKGKQGEAAPFSIRLIFILSLIAMSIYVGLEEGIVFFASQILEQKAVAVFPVQILIAVYWLGMGISRFAFSFVKKRLYNCMMIAFICSCVLMLLLLFTSNQWTVLICYCLFGVAIAPIWSYIMVFSALRFSSIANTAANAMMSMGALGGALMPMLLGGVIQISSVIFALAVLLAFMLLLGALLLKMSKDAKQSKAILSVE